MEQSTRSVRGPGAPDGPLADSVTEAVLLAGLPVAFGGHGPGVHVRPAEHLDGGRRDDLVIVDWLPSERLTAAAATAGAERASAGRTVCTALENALAEFLPAFGLVVDEHRPGAGVRVGRADAGALALPSTAVPAPREPGATPAELGIGATGVAAVRRAAALAGLPLARHTGDPGVTLGRCPAVGPDDAAAAGAADVGWNPSHRLTGPDPGVAAAVEAVHAAMLHAVGTALGACGTELRWVRPAGLPAQLRAFGPSGADAGHG
ncbi:hypothetical protein ACWGB8_10790 [Kitasatospora sp. NPDC054939]